MGGSDSAMNPLRFDLNLLNVLDVMLQTKNVTMAAAKLGVTQSAVSNALNRLREGLDDPMFVRTSDGMMPTVRAEQLAIPVREALFQIRQALEQRAEFVPEQSNRTFRLFMTDAGQMVLLPALLELVATEAPSVNIETHQVPSPRARAEAMERDEIDLAIGYFLDFEGSFHFRNLFDENYVCMVRANHPNIQGSLSLDDFMSLSHLVFEPPGGGHRYQEHIVETIFAEHGIKRRVAARISHLLGFSTMIEKTDLLTTIPYRLAEACAKYGNVQLLKPPIALPSFAVTQFWHERFHHDPGNRWLRNQFVRLFSNMNPILPDSKQ